MRNSSIFLTGSILLSIPFFTLFIASLVFIFGGTLNGFIFPLGILLSWVGGYIMATSFCTDKNILKHFKSSSWIVFISLILALLTGSMLYDYSFDGQWYHQEMILLLSRGWNPVYQFHSMTPNHSAALWVDHYTKGLETIWASVFCTTGNIESAKGVNFLMVGASFCLFYSMLCERFTHLSVRKRIFISLLFTLCPVVTAQWFTFYIDWSMYVLLLSLVSIILFPSTSNSTYKYILYGMIIFLASTIKWNILFWIGIVFLIYIGTSLMRKQYSVFYKLVITGAIALLVGVFLGAYNPYVTNTLDHSIPFYPLMGDDKVDIMTNILPVNLRGDNRVSLVFSSLFSYPTNKVNVSSEYLFPFSLKKWLFSLKAFISPDTRIAGFGPLFSGILILSLIIYSSVRIKDKQQRIIIGIILSALWCALFVLPSGWCARYVPFFWAMPLVMLLYCELSPKIPYWVCYLKRVVYVFLVVNSIVLLFIPLASAVYNQMNVYATTQQLKEAEQIPEINFGYIPSFSEKLKAVPHIEHAASIDTLSNWQHLYFIEKPNVGLYYNSNNAELKKVQRGKLWDLKARIEKKWGKPQKH